MNNGPSPSKRSILISCMPKILTGFSIVAFGIVLYFFVLKLSAIAFLIKKILNILSPIIYGFGIAYLINPIVSWLEKKLLSLISRYREPGKKIKGVVRNFSIVVGLCIFLFAIGIIFVLVVPELIDKISAFIMDFPENFAFFQLWLNKKIEHHPEITNIITTNLENLMVYFESFFETQIMPKINTYIGQFTTLALGAISVVKNLVIGIIVTVYALNSKEKFKGQAKKLIYACFKSNIADSIIDVSRHCDTIFGGFISGKVIDSVIIGILCFIGLSLLKIPYALIVSVIVGITNLIPFFGPYFGAVPSLILIMIVSPIKGLHFLIFIIVLQQFDGNILGPKILGDSTGLSAFWVLFAILLGGGLFGIVGMILGVPTFAVIYYVVKSAIDKMLIKKNLPVDSDEYLNAQNYESLCEEKIKGHN